MGTIYSVGSILSGHTLKHVAAAAACFAILEIFPEAAANPCCPRVMRRSAIDFRVRQVLAFLSVECLAVGIADDGSQTAPDRRYQTGFVWLAALLTFLWFAANSSFALEALGDRRIDFGASSPIFSHASPAHGAISASLRNASIISFSITGVFLVELVRANINMMRYVFAPRIDIKPGIVQDQNQTQDAGGAVGACELHRPYARIAGDRRRGRRPLCPLARREDDRYGRSNPRDCRRVRRASGENIWLKQSSSLQRDSDLCRRCFRRAAADYWTDRGRPSCGCRHADCRFDFPDCALCACRWPRHLPGCRVGVWRFEFFGGSRDRPLSRARSLTTCSSSSSTCCAAAFW